MLAFACLWPELSLHIDGEATLGSLVCLAVISEVESPEEDVERVGEVLLLDLELHRCVLELGWYTSWELYMPVHGLSQEFLLFRVVDTNFEVKWCLIRASNYLLYLWLLQ